MMEKVQRAIVAAWTKAKAVGISLMVAASLSLPAFASEGGGSSGASLSDIVSSTDTITTMVNQAWSMMTSNPLLRVYVAAGLLSVGIGFFGYLKRQSHR